MATFDRKFPDQWRTQSYVDELSKTNPYSLYGESKFYGVSLGLIVAHAINLISFSTFIGAFLFCVVACQVLYGRINYFLALWIEGVAGDLAGVNEKLNALKERLESMDKGLEGEFHNLENGLRTLDGKLISISEKIS